MLYCRVRLLLHRAIRSSSGCTIYQRCFSSFLPPRSSLEKNLNNLIFSRQLRKERTAHI
jgi:hypothetical protein